MRRSLFLASILFAALVPALMFLGCGSDSSTAPENTGTSLRPYIKSGQPGYVYRFAGIIDATGHGIGAGGPEGLPPDETALYWPQDVAFDPQGMVYILDWNNHRVLNLHSDGTINILIGGRFGDAPDGIADEIGLNHPTGLTFDPDGYLILSAWHNSIIKRMDLDTGEIWTICGIDDEVDNRNYNNDDIPAEQAYLDLPVNVAYDSRGNLIIGDQGNMLIRMIDTGGMIHRLTGRPPEIHPLTEEELAAYDDFRDCIAVNDDTDIFKVRFCGYSGDGGPAIDAYINTGFGQSTDPGGRVCLDALDNIYIADTSNNAVRKIDAVTGNISTVAGMGPDDFGYDAAHEGVPATQATLNRPRDLAFDNDGNLYIADTDNHCIRRVDTSGLITTVAGYPGVPGSIGVAPRPALTTEDVVGARFYRPYGVEIGPDGNLWVADNINHAIRVMIIE
jgi:sugar lactone lactonase YvrE